MSNLDRSAIKVRPLRARILVFITAVLLVALGSTACGSDSGSESSSSNSACRGGCSAGELCINHDGTQSCWPACAVGAECVSGCCAPLIGGGGACAPSTSYCGGGGGQNGGACPAGTYPLYAGGPCEPPTPSSCPNGWVVCNCPSEHGAWCHPPVCTPGGPTNYCGEGPSC